MACIPPGAAGWDVMNKQALTRPSVQGQIAPKISCRARISPSEKSERCVTWLLTVSSSITRSITRCATRPAPPSRSRWHRGVVGERFVEQVQHGATPACFSTGGSLDCSAAYSTYLDLWCFCWFPGEVSWASRLVSAPWFDSEQQSSFLGAVCCSCHVPNGHLDPLRFCCPRQLLEAASNGSLWCIIWCWWSGKAINNQTPRAGL